MKWFLTGLGLGTAIGMLYAPRSGAETQRQIRDIARDSMTKARETTDTVTEQFRSAGTRVEDAVRSAQSKAQESMESVKSAVGQANEPGSGARESLPTDFLGIINEWPQERLIEINGIGPVLASKIISNRPYESPEELVDSKLLPPSAIDSLRKVS